MKKNTVLAIAFLAFCILLSVATMWMFRTESISHPFFGELSLQFRWGKPHLLRMDINSDSRIDFEAVWPGYQNGEPPVECWSDPGERGYFEYHVVFDQDGFPEYVEIDEDGDGKFDRVLSDEEVYALRNGEFMGWKQFQQRP